MKASPILRTTVMLATGLLATIQLNNAQASNAITTEMVFHKNEWMPVCNLAPVECSAEKVERHVVEARIVNGKVMPFMTLATVTIRPDGSNSPVEVRPVRTVPAGQRVAVIKVNGTYMPYMEMEAVAVTAEGAATDNIAVVAPAKHTGAEGRVFTISARKTFDSLVNLLAERAMHFFKSLFAVNG